MPRLRPVKTQEEIELIPRDEPVEIDLAPEKAPEVETKTVETAPPKIEEPPAQEEQQDDAAVELKRHLEEMQRQNEANAAALAQETQRRQQAERQAWNANRGQERAQYDVIVNAISAVETEITSAKAEHRRALEANDWDAATEAQARMSDAYARLVPLNDGRLAFEAQEEQRRQALPQQQRQPSLQEWINNSRDFYPAEKTWLLAHPETLTDAKKYAALTHHYNQAMDKGLSRGSNEYFQYLEEQLGYRQQNEQRQRNVSVQAPPSREAPSIATGRPTSTRITLTPEQREAARTAGVTEIEYARGLIEMEQRRAQGNLPSR